MLIIDNEVIFEEIMYCICAKFNKTGLDLFQDCCWVFFIISNPPMSQASWEVANLFERKILHTPVYGVKEFVCLLQTLTQIIKQIVKYIAK